MAVVRAARHDQPGLRQPCALRRRQDARRRRRALDEGRAGRRHHRHYSTGDPNGADGLRAAAVQPDGDRRRECPCDRRQLLRSFAGGSQRRRLRGGAVEPRNRPVADARVGVRYTPVPLDRAAAARRARALVRRRNLRNLRPGRVPRKERTDFLAALSVPERRHSCPAAHDRRRADDDVLRRGDEHRDGKPGIDHQGGPRPARRGHALEQHGAALHPADLYRGHHELDGHRAGQRQHRAAGRLHALHYRRERSSFGRAHGHSSG